MNRINFLGRMVGWTQSLRMSVAGCRARILNKACVKSLLSKTVYPWRIRRAHKLYARVEKQLRNKVRRGEKIKVAFMVSLSTMFPARPLFEYLYENRIFDLTLLVVPDYRFDAHDQLENARKNMQKTIDEFSEYKSVMVVSPLERETDTINLKDLADIIFPSVPYDVSHFKYKLTNLAYQGVLPAIVNYGFYRSYYDREYLIASHRSSMYWRIFAETHYNFSEYENFQWIKGRNVVLTGYCKMDAYTQELSARIEGKKTIMISPHHSVAGGYNDTLGLSNFHKYADLFLSLPDEYPEVMFIFRPHPILFICLEAEGFWGKEKVREYISSMASKPNVIYSDGGDYFKEFALSDALIQDCGSYLVEYFYTKKPCCYMLKQSSDITEKFTELGQKCLGQCYIAYDEQAIRNFVEQVVIKGEDYMKDEREKFAEEEVMLNYPRVSQEIIKHLVDTFN